MFEEIARTKSCIFALENFHEPVEFRIAAINRYGSLPINTNGYIIRLNQPTCNYFLIKYLFENKISFWFFLVNKETSFFNKKILVILASIFGGGIFFFLLCCLCGTCHRDRMKFSNRNTLYEKDSKSSF
jgi:hypothetical protein